ncbi:MFS transporter [Microbacterium sp. Marseille-Q6965]|uniref:MFS transporter n=1 Tax=Microbacterium sp. Marseille-Q6965 TaxID=2965072 RepID=UPI0021B799F0|nr:MFS transporter [Microbacterium sp. Marseille-Q6965]
MLQCAVLGSLTAPVAVGLSVLVRRHVGPDDAAGVLGVIIALGSLGAMIANPLFGWCADATRHRVGRRAWLIGGGLAGLAGTAAVAMSPDAISLAVSWVLTQVAYNACYGAINGLVSDGLPPEERTRAAGFFAAAAFLGTLPGLAMAAAFPTDIVPMLLTVPAVAAVVIVVIGILIERPADVRVPTTEARDGRRGLREIASRAFVAAFVVRLVVAIEMAAGLTYALYLFMDRWGAVERDAVRLVSLSTLLGAAALVLVSFLVATTRLRAAPPRILVVSGIALLTVGMVGRGVAPTVEVFQAATVLAGAGIGLAAVATRSLVQAALPPERSAFGLGVFNVANTLGPIVGPLIAAWLVHVAPGLGFSDAYAGMYLLLALPVVAVAALVPLLRPSARVRSDQLTP